MSKLKAKFTLNPDYKNLMLETPEPQAVLRFTLRRWGGWIVGPLILIGLLTILILNAHANQTQSARLINEGQSAQAQVTGCTEGPMSRSGRYMDITARYEVGGQVYDNTYRLRVPACRDYPAGSWVPMIYNPSNPSESAFDGWTTNPISLAHVVIGLILVGMLLAVTVYSLRKIRQDLHTLRAERPQWQQGILLDGEIIGVERDKHTRSMITLQYEVVSPRHKTLMGWTSASRPDLKNTSALIGTPIFVLYMSDNNHKAL